MVLLELPDQTETSVQKPINILISLKICKQSVLHD